MHTTGMIFNIIGCLFAFLFSYCLCVSSVCRDIGNSERLDCYPEAYATEQKCLARNCCWRLPDEGANNVYVPTCYFPRNYPTYNVKSTVPIPGGSKYILHKDNPMNIFAKEYHRVGLEIYHETENRLRLKFASLVNPSWEPPIPMNKPTEIPQSTAYKVQVLSNPFRLKVSRNKTDDTIIDLNEYMSTAFTMSDQFLQIAFRLYTERGYGLGERRTRFPITLDRWVRAAMWNRDQAPIDDVNLYGVHNFFMSLDVDGNSFGIFLLNSNAQEVAIQPLPAITYRSTGGLLDFYLFMGPTPKDVIAQYYDLIGHPSLPPYWSLGFNLCRYGYKNTEEVRHVMNRNLDSGIPMDVQWVDIDYMNKERDWTLDPYNFRNYGRFITNEVQIKHGMKAVIIVDPAIPIVKDYFPYEMGLRMGIFINDSRTGEPLIGSVWPGDTHFPDFSHPNIQEWWNYFAKSFHKILPFNGLWIDMNEPSNFYDGSKTGCDDKSALDNPPYVPQVLGGHLFDKTVCPSALHYNNSHYNLHNIYSYLEAIVAHKSLVEMYPEKRPFLLTRSSFAGSGVYTNHWTGDNFATWSDMKKSIAQIINFNIFGIPLVGADICGFNGETNEELCVRWHQLGAFYPFSRNHNTKGASAQDPAAFSGKATGIIRDALKLRYQILPYLYGLLYEAHLEGKPVARALAFEYPTVTSTHFIDEQFMLGSCLLVSPVLQPGVTQVTSFMPQGSWMNLISMERFESVGSFYQLFAPIEIIPVHIKAGCAIPMQRFAMNTGVARKYGLQLFVVLLEVDSGEAYPPTGEQASGVMYWDDGETKDQMYLKAEFNVVNRTLTSQSKLLGKGKRTEFNSAIDSIFIQGVSRHPRSVVFESTEALFTYLEKTNLLIIHPTSGSTFEQSFKIQWRF